MKMLLVFAAVFSSFRTYLMTEPIPTLRCEPCHASYEGCALEHDVDDVQGFVELNARMCNKLKRSMGMMGWNGR